MVRRCGLMAVGLVSARLANCGPIVAAVAAKLHGDDALVLLAEAANSKKDFAAGVENANFCLFGGGPAFVRLTVTEIGDRCGESPQRIVQRAVQFWRVIGEGEASCEPASTAGQLVVGHSTMPQTKRKKETWNMNG